MQHKFSRGCTARNAIYVYSVRDSFSRPFLPILRNNKIFLPSLQPSEKLILITIARVDHKAAGIFCITTTIYA